MDVKPRLKYLFDLFSKNYAIHAPGKQGLVACPVCLLEFDSSALATRPCPLSLGHVYPQARGGKLTTLECTRCNNTLGSKADSFSLARDDWHQYLRKGGTQRAVFGVGELKFNAEITKTDKGFEVLYLHDRNPPGLERKVKEAAASATDLSMSYRIPTKQRAACGDWHVAHLSLFNRFGYEYALSYSGRQIAGWLRNLSVPEHAHKWNIYASEEFSTLRYVCLVVVDDLTRCFGVCFPGDQAGRHRAILAPGFTKDAFERWTTMLASTSKDTAFRVLQMSGEVPQSVLADDTYKGLGQALFEGQLPEL